MPLVMAGLVAGVTFLFTTLGEVENPKSNKVLNNDIIVDCLCHECLYTALKDEAMHLPEKELKFKLVHKNKSYFSVINEQREGGFF